MGHAVTVAEPRRDMDPRLAALLGLDPNRAPARMRSRSCWRATGRMARRSPASRCSGRARAWPGCSGWTPGCCPTPEQMARILDGKRADGAALPAERAAAIRGRLLELYGFRGKRRAESR